MVIDAFSPEARPEVDIRTLIDEMILLDSVLIEGIIRKRERKIKLTGDKAGQQQLALLRRCLGPLENEEPLLDCEFTPEEEKQLRGYQFLTQKPLLIVLNIAEDSLGEADNIYRKHAGFVEAGLATDKVIRKSYALLGLISYLTATAPEARAWTIKKGTTAQEAAGVIHSDIERGFIRAEVVAYEDYDRLETIAAIKAAGKHHLEGKQYVVRDGDVILFRFNV